MAAFDFPNSPSVNDQYTANGVTFKWNGTIWQRISASSGAQGTTGSTGPTGAQGAAAGLTISTSAPGSPSAGDMWWDSDAGLFLTYYNDGNSSQWVELNQGPRGAQGATGPTGAQGATGPTGAQGAAGAQGATGAAGSNASITSNADNRVITGGSGTNLNGEANLTFDGTNFSVTGAANIAGTLILQPGGTAWSTTNTRPQLGRQADGELRLGAGSDSASNVTFYTSPSAGGTLAERLRITSGGNVQVNGGALHLDASGELAVFETDTNLAFTNSAKLAFDFSGNVARIRTSGNGSFTTRPLAFYTGNDERLRITSGGVVKIGGDVSNASSDVGTVTKLTIKQHTNTHEGGMYIERSGERRGFYMYVGGAGGLNDALCITTNQLGTDTNVLGIDRSNRLTKLGGDVVIDNSNNGYGGLRIVDSSAGEYSVNYIAGRNSGATAHVFSIGGRTQNSSPWANASQSECARISQRGISFNGDDAQANALDDYEEGSYTPNVQTDNGVNAGLAVGQGYYVKVGKVVTVHLKIETNSHNSVNTTGQYKVSLPFLSLAQGDTQGTLMCSIWSIGSSSISWMGGQVHNNNAWTHIAYHNGSNNNTNNLTPQLASNQLQFRGTVVYRSNA